MLMRMKRTKLIFIAVIIFAYIVGCTDQQALVDKNHILKVEVCSLGKRIFPNKVITDHYKIFLLVKELNKVKKEPAVFKANYQIMIYYDNGNTVLLLCNYNRLNIRGITYIHDLPIRDIVNSLFQ